MKNFKQIILTPSFVLAVVTGISSGMVFADDDHSTINHSALTTDYKAASSGTQNLTLGPVTIKMLLDESNLGRGDIEVGELTLPPEYGKGVPHPHGSLEIFYVVKGILGHEVNGRTYTLNPGDLGFVNPGDQVRHSVLSDIPVKAIVIWLPGGEAAALVAHAGFKREKIE